MPGRTPHSRLLPFALCCAVALAASSVGAPAATPVVVDTHVHLTNLSLLSYPWLMHSATLNHTWTLANYTTAAAGSAIVAGKAVFIEVGRGVGGGVRLRNGATEREWEREREGKERRNVNAGFRLSVWRRGRGAGCGGLQYAKGGRGERCGR